MESENLPIKATQHRKRRVEIIWLTVTIPNAAVANTYKSTFLFEYVQTS